jgi:hypothetical protein
MKHGRNIEQQILIYDLKGFGLQHFHRPALRLLKMIAEIDQANYPEVSSLCFFLSTKRLGRLYVVNAPSLFTSLWKVIQMWLDPAIIAKVMQRLSAYETKGFNPRERLQGGASRKN